MARTKTFIGLDFGAHAVKAVWLQGSAAAPRIVKREALHLPADAQDTARFVEPWLEKHGLARAVCAIALPGTQTVFQPSRLPAGDPRTPEQAAAMEVATFNDMADDHMTHDVVGFEMTHGERQLLIAMARPGVIARVQSDAILHSIRVGELVPAPVCLFNACQRFAGPAGQPSLYVDIGHSRTEIAVGPPAGILFARAYPTGGRSFTDAIARHAGLTTNQAENVKVSEAGLETDNAYAEVLTPVVDLWLGQLNSCLSVYRSQFTSPKSEIGQIVLAGGGAALSGLAEYVRAHLKLPVVSVAALPEADPHIDLRGFECAYGLALSAIGAAKSPLSLLPARVRDELVFREKKPYWIATGILLALTLAIFTASGLHTISRTRTRLAQRRTQLEAREKLAKQIEQKQARKAEIREMATPLRNILQAGPIMREVITLVANAIHPDDWISMVSDETSYFTPPDEPSPATAPRKPPKLGLREPRTPRPKKDDPPTVLPALASGVVVEGYTPNASLITVKELIHKLKLSPLVADADLLSDDRVLNPELFHAGRLAEGQDLHHFVIRVEVNRP